MTHLCLCCHCGLAALHWLQHVFSDHSSIGGLSHTPVLFHFPSHTFGSVDARAHSRVQLSCALTFSDNITATFQSDAVDRNTSAPESIVLQYVTMVSHFAESNAWRPNNETARLRIGITSCSRTLTDSLVRSCPLLSSAVCQADNVQNSVHFSPDSRRVARQSWNSSSPT